MDRRKLIQGLSASVFCGPTLAVTNQAQAQSQPQGYGHMTAETRRSLFQTNVYDLEQYRVSLHWRTSSGQPFGSLANLANHLRQEGQQPVELMNAGIYSEQMTPLGLHVEKGRTLVPLNQKRGNGNFFVRPNGVFYLDGQGAHIVRTSRFRQNRSIKMATQSGPLLFDRYGVQRKFSKNSNSLYIRNAVGVLPDGKIATVLTRQPCNMRTLLDYMRLDLKCVSALYLDGSISNRWFSGRYSRFSWNPMVGMLAISKLGQRTVPRPEQQPRPQPQPQPQPAQPAPQPQQQPVPQQRVQPQRPTQPVEHPYAPEPGVQQPRAPQQPPLQPQQQPVAQPRARQPFVPQPPLPQNAPAVRPAPLKPGAGTNSTTVIKKYRGGVY